MQNLVWATRRFLRFTSRFLVFLFLANPQSFGQIDAVSDIRALAEASDGEMSFDVKATIGFVQPNSYIDIQQGKWPLNVELPHERMWDYALKPGMTVRVRGQFDSARSRAIATEIEILGQTALKPVRTGIHPGEIKSRSHLYCTSDGIVRYIVRLPSRVILHVNSEHTIILVELVGEYQKDDLLKFCGKHIRFEGTVRYPSLTRARLMLNSLSQIEMLNPVDDDDSFKLQAFEDAKVIFSDRKASFVITHKAFGDPVFMNTPFASHVQYQDKVNLVVVTGGKNKKFKERPATYRARYVEFNDRLEKSSGEIPSVFSKVRGVVKGKSRLDSLIEIQIETEDGEAAIVRIPAKKSKQRVAGLDRGDRIRVRGLKYRVNSGGRSDNTPAFLTPTIQQIELVSRPVRVEKIWLIIGGTILSALGLGIYFWNGTLRHKVALRTRGLAAVTSHMKTTFDAVQEAILLADERGNVTYANRQFENCFGFHPQIGAAIRECLRQIADASEVPALFTEFYQGHQGQIGKTFELYVDGKCIQVFRNEVLNDDQERVGELWSFNDCTQQRKLEHELLQSQKMEALGQLSGGVAHDFNNLLTVVSNNLRILNYEAIEKGVEFDDCLISVEAAVERAADLTRQLLDFSRNSQLSSQICDVNSIAAEVYEMARRTMDASIDLQLHISPFVLPARVDRTRIGQVILNLCINARDSIAGGKGRIRITTSRQRHETLGETACIAVADSGAGMNKEVQRKIFEPFFTTKPRGSGTGLGLSTAVGIIQQHQGKIEFDSVVNKGTEFRVHLPIESNLVIERREQLPISPTRKGLDLLLVDDESEIRKTGKCLLKRLGHEVVTVSNGAEAIRAIEDHDNFDAVLMDLTMPVMSGNEAYAIIQERWPRLPVAICSGYAAERLQVATKPTNRLEYLPKPFRLNELETVLSRLTT